MIDCSRELNKFYRKKVILPETEQSKLREKRKLNVKRLKDGLIEYNEEKNTDYKVAEDRIQGSMAMHTVIQNDESDYDIDVGIVFDSDNLDGLGPLATRNMVGNALKRKTKQFAEEPEIKTNCVRVKYSEGYHVDFALYKRYKEDEEDDEYIYEHSGPEWSIRDLRALDLWFKEQIKYKGTNLRKIIRLSKMFCRSRGSWKNMPSGLIQTVLCEEKLDTNYERLDEVFYYSMKAIVSMLNIKLEVEAPVDNGRALVTRDIDYTRMKNWKKRLEDKLKDLDVLFKSDCTKDEALKAWGDFFNHSYWEELVENSLNKSFSVVNYDDTEEFIDDLYPVYEKYDVTIDCRVSGNGFSEMSIIKYLGKYAPSFKNFIPFNFQVKCKIQDTNCPSYDKVLWKVRNIGGVAERNNCIRGQIKDRGREIVESTSFTGPHYIECYLIKDGICLAVGHVSVPIGGE